MGLNLTGPRLLSSNSMEANLSPVETMAWRNLSHGETHRLAKLIACETYRRLAKHIVWRNLSPGETCRLANPIAWRNLSPGETYRLAKPMAWQSLTKHSSGETSQLKTFCCRPSKPIGSYRDLFLESSVNLHGRIRVFSATFWIRRQLAHAGWPSHK